MLSSRSCKVVEFVEYTLSFRYPHSKKSNGVKSCEKGDHAMSSNLLINRFGKATWKVYIVSSPFGMLTHLVETTYFIYPGNDLSNKYYFNSLSSIFCI